MEQGPPPRLGGLLSIHLQQKTQGIRCALEDTAMPRRDGRHHQKRRWAADLPGGPPKETQGQVLFALRENDFKTMSSPLQPHQPAAPRPVDNRQQEGPSQKPRVWGTASPLDPAGLQVSEGTLSRGSGGHFAAAASAAPQRLNPPADMQVSPRLCSQACRKSLLLAVCLSELITPAPGSSPRRSGSLRGLGEQGRGHGGGETQPLTTGVTLPRLLHLFCLFLLLCHPAVTLGMGRACVRAEILQSALKAAV